MSHCEGFSVYSVYLQATDCYLNTAFNIPNNLRQLTTTGKNKLKTMAQYVE